ncbi:MAG: hypothetical protein H7255_08825 [Ramlibacter sp.]|nr:hypothetical protein [Ramlibacter sp.]
MSTTSGWTAEDFADFERRIREDEREKMAKSQEGWESGGKKHVIDVYARLHTGKIGMHWMWAAIERMVFSGESEAAILDDFGYALRDSGKGKIPK